MADKNIRHAIRQNPRYRHSQLINDFIHFQDEIYRKTESVNEQSHSVQTPSCRRWFATRL